MEKIEIIQHEWRAKLQKSLWVFVALSCLAEVVIFVLRVIKDRIQQGQFSHDLVLGVILPVLFNVCIALIVNNINKSYHSEAYKNNAYVYGALGLAFIIVTSHAYFSWTLCCYVFPIIVSVFFIDKKLTRRSFVFSIIGMYISVFLSKVFDSDVNLTNLLVIACLNIAYLVIIFLICNQLIQFLNQKNEMIEDYDKEKLDLGHALTLDAMTSLYNHAEFNRVIEMRREECIKFKQFLSLVIVDIDHFKNVNDTYGHEQGDKVLINVANNLMHFCSDKGQVFRYGGEEFAIIFMNQTAHQTLAIMEEVRDCLSMATYDFMPEDQKVTVSVGIYKYGGETQIDSHDIFNFADSAMYEAKNTGRNKCCIYNCK